ncbi:MAG: DNA replication/repair protein RecF [Clostridia bacterium]|nr:DNA replication/repair protein RecF [Clostridia bacterium]
MICQSVSLKNFRNIPAAHVNFCSGINLVMGNNAQGKTNLLESIALMAIGKSFRDAKEAEMIRFGQTQSMVELTYHDTVRQQIASVMMDATKRRVWMQNGNKVPKVADMVGQFRTVIFMPEHLSLIKSGPELRRNFLDIALCQMRPVYMNALQRYNGILKERNRLLKQAGEQGTPLSVLSPMLDVWTEQLAAAAAVLAPYRAEFVEKMNRAAVEVFCEMTDGKEIPRFVYKGVLGYGEENQQNDAKNKIFQKMEESYIREIAAGVTLHGCHRDDIEIYLNDKSARLYASQGQQRSLSLSMKLAEGEISKETHGDYPVFLFDDVLSELDRGRREYLISKISGKQVVMTGCEQIDAISQIKHRNTQEHRVISVEGGAFFEEES